MKGKATEGPATPDEPRGYGGALVKVVTGLQNDPILLYGIGAGILVTGALAFTTSVALVLIVAGLFVVVLAARVHQQTQRVRRGGGTGIAFGSSLDDADVGTDDSGGGGRASGFVFFSRAKNSRVGAVGGRKRRRPPEP